jgi:hypothetical protein
MGAAPRTNQGTRVSNSAEVGSTNCVIATVCHAFQIRSI